MNECCKTCNYCREVKKLPNYQEVLAKICLFHVIENNEAYILEVNDNDRCECYWNGERKYER